MALDTIVYIATSLDGYIAGPNDELDWLFHDQDYGYSEFIASIGTIVMGRRSYEVTRSFGDWPWPQHECIVLSRTLPEQEQDNIRIVNRDAVELVAELRKRIGRYIWIMGGGEIVRDLLNANLVDELHMAVHPCILGVGLPLFPEGTKPHPLELIDSQSYDSGLVMLRYRCR